MKPTLLFLAAFLILGTPLSPAQTAAPIAKPEFRHNVGGVVTLTCATPGAAIWFTTDDSYPYPGTKDDGYADSTSQLYSDPITLALDTPTLIRAASYQDGYIGSSIERFTITITNP